MNAVVEEVEGEKFAEALQVGQTAVFKLIATQVQIIHLSCYERKTLALASWP